MYHEELNDKANYDLTMSHGRKVVGVVRNMTSSGFGDALQLSECSVQVPVVIYVQLLITSECDVQCVIDMFSALNSEF